MEKIRRATPNDIERLDKLLYEVQEVHHQARPDLFKGGTKKYTDDELLKIIKNESTPIFVYDDKGILGYAFCIIKEEHCHTLTDIKTLYIDDFCVDEEARGKHVGRKLYDFVVEFAKGIACYNLTLNVWADNVNALRFYEKIGLSPQKIGMEKILK